MTAQLSTLREFTSFVAAAVRNKETGVHREGNLTVTADLKANTISIGHAGMNRSFDVPFADLKKVRAASSPDRAKSTTKACAAAAKILRPIFQALKQDPLFAGLFATEEECVTA
ncbi:MAG: hypothetical protein KDD66_03935 [Bdellovibrionales bacterium]|nr:hypothetical protein [Bdellovibrionales bacterium]